ncbi:MAG: cupin domain-containing protein [Chloroflexi bacterium]|nr:cupin domain-containing protein [Chloroflexota bacterium]
MGNFYDEWLNYWDAEREEFARARKVMHEEDLEWVRTRQDYRAALLCARENGFITAGTTMVAEIPPGWNTGMHSHGEESMFIVEGTGFSVVDGKRYDWETGSTLFMPYGSLHQHYNTGKSMARYYSVMGLGLQRFAGLARVMQHEDARETPIGYPKDVEKAESDIHPQYGRIVARLKDVPRIEKKEQGARMAKATDIASLNVAEEMRTAGIKGHHGALYEIMKAPENGFKASEGEITHIMCDPPGGHSGKHAHMEAVIYVWQGEGYSMIDGERIDWKKGTLLHVQGPQTVHQHFNTCDIESRFIRVEYGLRKLYFQPIAKRIFPYVYYDFSSD